MDYYPQRDPGQWLRDQPQTQPRPKQVSRMAKERAVALASGLKKGLIAFSIVGFATFSLLAANHQVGNAASATQNQSQPTQAAPANGDDGSSPFRHHNDDNGNFFNQPNQGGNNFGSGNSNQSPPVSRSNAS